LNAASDGNALASSDGGVRRDIAALYEALGGGWSGADLAPGVDAWRRRA
jgi:rhodanese-related sulfurtransferase